MLVILVMFGEVSDDLAAATATAPINEIGHLQFPNGHDVVLHVEEGVGQAGDAVHRHLPGDMM